MSTVWEPFLPPLSHGQGPGTPMVNGYTVYTAVGKVKEPERDSPNVSPTNALGTEGIMDPLASIEDRTLGSGVVAYLMASMADGTSSVVRILLGEETLIGRQSLCQFRISHPSCSNIHYRIYSIVFESRYEPLIYCEDLSMNGTFLNGRLIGKGASVLLNHGDRIEIRHTASFTFQQVPGENAPKDPVTQREKGLLVSSYKISPRILGAGGYGRVYMAWDVKTHRQVACKIMELKVPDGRRNGKQKNLKRMKKMFMREVEVLKTLNHPNIMSIHKAVSTNSRIYIFEELITGGDLFSHLGQKLCFDEIEAMPIVWQILKALEYLHENGIVHRDLKPDNILCTSNAAGARVVLTDFGSARFFTPATRMTSAVGTLEYLAPEILPTHKTTLNHGYSKSVDLWSLGIVVYVLLSGCSPFGSGHGSTPPPDMVMTKARSCDLSHLETAIEWKEVSAEAKDFIKSLVCVDPRKRMTAEQAKKHKWLSRHTKELEEVYTRAVEDWGKRRTPEDKNVTFEHFNISQSQHGPTTEDTSCNDTDYEVEQIGNFDFEPGSSVPRLAITMEGEDSSMLDIPELFDQFTPESPSDYYCRVGTVDETIENEGNAWHMNGLYTVEEDELHDAAAGDGRLRSAMELAREVEERRQVRIQQLKDRDSSKRGGMEERSRFF